MVRLRINYVAICRNELVYDQLTQDQPYEKWFEIVKNHCKDESNILDIGCGTGSLTVQLEALGNVIGIGFKC